MPISTPPTPIAGLTPEQQFQLQMRQMELEIARLNASNPNPSGFSQRSKLSEYKKEVRIQKPQASIKLKGKGNYDDWSDDILSVALSIEAKGLLQLRQVACPLDEEEIEEKAIWEFKSKVLFDIIYAAIEPPIKRIIKNRINEDQRNGAELWIALETEYKTHLLDTRAIIYDKITKIHIKDYAHDVIKYIAAYRRLAERLESLGYPLHDWELVERFISGLGDHQAEFIQSKKDLIRESRDRGSIEEIDLNDLMIKLTARANGPSEKKTAVDGNKLIEDGKGKGGGQQPANEKKVEKKGPNGGGKAWEQECSYCGYSNHNVSNCWYKHPTKADTGWKEEHKESIEKLRNLDESKEPVTNTGWTALDTQPRGLAVIAPEPDPDPDPYRDSLGLFGTGYTRNLGVNGC